MLDLEQVNAEDRDLEILTPTCFPLDIASLWLIVSSVEQSFYQLHSLVTISVSSMMCEGAVKASSGIMAPDWEAASVRRLRGGFQPDSPLES